LRQTMAPQSDTCRCFSLFVLLLYLPFNDGFVYRSLVHHPQKILRNNNHCALKDTNHNNNNNEPNNSNNNMVSSNAIYFDISVAGTPIGRLLFHLANPSPLPQHAENVIRLATGARRSIEPLTHYVGCTFDFTPAHVEDGQGRYRWSHTCKGRGRNAMGRQNEPISDAPNQLASCTHSCFGGQYYGETYKDDDDDADDPGVLLTVPIQGPGQGSSRFSIVRVKESPQEWRERLLMNSGVIGRLDPSSLETLHTMARQRIGPPTVTASGAA